MNINKKISNFIDIINDLEDIGKKLYLESPEIWIDFCDKIGSKDLDEMVLFYAARYNYVSIIKYVEYNKIIDLDAPSKNKSFPSIRKHLLAVSKDYKSEDVYNFLNNSSATSSTDNSNKDENVKQTTNTNNDKKQEEVNTSSYFPVFLCPNCNTNILNSGYKVYEEVNYVFSQEKNKTEEISRKKDSRVFCNSCNNNINNVTTELLENICNIHNCKKCGKDLIKIGINEKTKMEFSDSNNKFTNNKKTYNCPYCDEELTDSQVKYFNL